MPEAETIRKGPSHGLGADCPPALSTTGRGFRSPPPLERDADPPAVEMSLRECRPGLSTHVASGWHSPVTSWPRSPAAAAASAHAGRYHLQADPVLCGDTCSHSVPPAAPWVRCPEPGSPRGGLGLLVLEEPPF